MPNRLAASTSPYLRQHADNPVDWHEWGDEAFAEAAERDVPILLSVGYSACHWCHVMAHESFEDEETAAMMNALFVNVKVDREERPDVDSVYMDAVQATTGRGGWPMTVFLAHDGEPIFAGTYFPKVSHLGYPSFTQVLEGVSRAWTENRETLLEIGRRIVEAISQPVAPGELPGEDQLALAFRKIITVADPVNGGFGGDPKFPQQPVLEFLLRVGDEPWAEHARPILATTLIAMARGGIYDQVGGGFFRYSVDGQWKIPHFEKMLYDNAQLARIYAWAWRELDDPELRAVAEDTLRYMVRELQLPTGGFCASQDADSEGIEGLFYLWPYFEFLEATGRDGTLAAAHFGVTPEEFFENGNHLHVASPVPELAKTLRLPVAEVSSGLARARGALLERRSHRVPPGLDHKVIAAWNGLAIRAFAEAGATFDRPDLVEVAREAARFVLGKMGHPDGGLFRVWSEGVAKVPGFLDDHASMAVGLFSLYAVTGEVEWFEAADRLTRIIPQRFVDPQGGFFTTADHSSRLITRPKDQSDNPMPSGNSLAAEALVMLSSYTGDPVALGWAEGVVRAGAAMLERYPAAGGHLASVAYSMSRRRELAIVGPDAKRFTDLVWSRFRPELAVAMNPTGYPTSIPLLAGRGTKGVTTAYLCHGMVCDAPVTDPAELAL